MSVVGVGLGDFIAIPKFALQVYQLCRDAPEDFRDLASLVKSLLGALQGVSGVITTVPVTESTREQGLALLHDSKATLEEVETKLQKFKNKGSKSFAKRDLVRWVVEDLGSTRIRIQGNIIGLTVYLQHLTLIQQVGNKEQLLSLETRLDQTIAGLAQSIERLSTITQQQKEYSSSADLTLSHTVQHWKCQRWQKCQKAPKCLECSLESIQIEPTNGTALDDIATNLIPAFYTSTFFRKYVLWGKPVRRSFLRGGTILAQCGNIKLAIPSDSSYAPLGSIFVNGVSGATSEFQATFPDEFGFRVSLVTQCLHFRNSFPDDAEIIDAGLTFLVLTLVIAHAGHLDIDYANSSSPASTMSSAEINNALFVQTDITLRVSLERTLRRLLFLFERAMKDPRREKWPAACFAICSVFMAAESLQVDLYINNLEGIGAMENSAIKLLVGMFRRSTNGLDPLRLDWSDERNRELLGGDYDKVYALQDLQDLCHEYGGFLRERRKISFTSQNTDCLTGKLVSRILIDAEEV